MPYISHLFPLSLVCKLIGNETELGEDLRHEFLSHGSFPAAALSAALIGLNACLSSLRFLTVQLNTRTKKYSANGSQSLCTRHSDALPHCILFVSTAQIRRSGVFTCGAQPRFNMHWSRKFLIQFKNKVKFCLRNQPWKGQSETTDTRSFNYQIYAYVCNVSNCPEVRSRPSMLLS